MFKKITKSGYAKVFLLFLMLLFIGETTYIPMAKADVGSWINSSLTGSIQTGQAGYYHAQGEDIYTAGYTRLRFGTVPGTTSLFTISPPQFNIGCSGIDAMWGGFAMMSGAELEKIMQNIISVAIPFAFNMALGILCKQCETILQQLEAIANKFNGLNFNSCRTSQAAANFAVGGIGNDINSTLGSGASNSWQSGVASVLGPVSGTNGNYSGGVEGLLSSVESAIPSSNCTQSSSGAQTAMNALNNCQSEQLAEKNQLGSLLRTIADNARLGLTDGGAYGLGTGGANDLIGILRGSFLGDVGGYVPTPAQNIPPEYEQLSVGSLSGTAVSGSALSDPLSTLLTGGDLMSVVENYDSFSSNPPYQASVIQGVNGSGLFSNPTMYCFYGLKYLYFNYLNNIEQGLYGSGAALTYMSQPQCPSGTVTAPNGNLTPSQQAAFIEDSPIPVVELIKMDYVNQLDGALINQAAQVMAEQALVDWMHAIILGVNANLYTGKKLNYTQKKYNIGVKAFQTNADKLNKELISKLQGNQAATMALLKQLNRLNRIWVRSLSAGGLLGNYNFSRHLP